RLDVFALSIYGLVVFPKALRHVDEAVTDLFDQLDKKLLLVWFHSHFWKVDKVSYQVFSKNYSPLKEIVATPRRDDILEEKWMAILQNLQECGNFDWVPLLGIWRAIGYAPLLVLRQYRSRQFIPATQGIADCEFSYKDDGYRKKIQEMSSAWKQTHRMKGLAVGSMTTPKYNEWWGRRINDNIPMVSQEGRQSIEKHLRVIPSELEIIRQDFERRNMDLERKIEQMEEEKMNLRLYIDVRKLKTEKLRKEKNKAVEQFDSLKTDYKKLCLSMRTAGLGKTSEQWRAKIREEKDKADKWE
ncbi:hypothetical protein Goshw_010477, partial [Gossypium schwendimanii]|nr:hypothetical protein [Gossypium schwendimanii]